MTASRTIVDAELWILLTKESDFSFLPVAFLDADWLVDASDEGSAWPLLSLSDIF
jgi:hypothetical protein